MNEYWSKIWAQFKRHPAGVPAFIVVILFAIVGIYAPFLASSKPLVVDYNGEWYFPLFRYFFYTGFFTKRIDIFFNLLMFTLPLGVLFFWIFRKNRMTIPVFILLQFVLFFYFGYRTPNDPAADPALNIARQVKVQQRLQQKEVPINWQFDLDYMTSYEKLNQLLRFRLRKEQHERLQQYRPEGSRIPTLWTVTLENWQRNIKRQENVIQQNVLDGTVDSFSYRTAQAKLNYLLEKRKWLVTESQKLDWVVMPLIRHFHWEDDAGGKQSLNQYLPWWELTRTNRKDLVAALIFGVRISLVVGILAVALALAIGIPIGAFAGYYGGKFDILVSRLLEIWESMPTFFMLLFIVSITQSKSIFLVVAVVGVFGWTGFSRYIRGEFFKQRNLPYVEACQSQGFRDRYVIFTHILPNAIPPLLTLLPFSIMGAITSEAGLSFLGLGEEGSCSWGVLMDEGRSAFPGESYLLWPPAILLTTLLVAIALVGDALRDALDPKMHR